MNSLNQHKTGLALGALAGLWHVVWSVLVALGLAQPFINWVLALHMVQEPFSVLPFSFITAIELVAFAFIVGYIVGRVFAWLSNWAHKQ